MEITKIQTKSDNRKILNLDYIFPRRTFQSSSFHFERKRRSRSAYEKDFLGHENYRIMTTKNSFYHRFVYAANAITLKVLFLLSEYHQVVIRVSFISWDFPRANPTSNAYARVISWKSISPPEENYANCRI